MISSVAFQVSSAQFLNYTPETVSDSRWYQKEAAKTSALENTRMKGLSTLVTLQRAVEDMETKLNIDVRWQPDDAKWIATTQATSLRDFQRVCDKLEGLMVSRLFEFTKLNQSGTGLVFRSFAGSNLIFDCFIRL